MALAGHMPTHSFFTKVWASKRQLKHKIFSWLLLHDKLNTRDRLGIRHMALDSYNCENCIWQHRETSYHLFLRCNFALRCWASIGIQAPRISCPKSALARLTKQVPKEYAIEIVTLMLRGIWKSRNAWIFENTPPTVEGCRNYMRTKLHHLQLRLKPSAINFLLIWMSSIHLIVG
jgi:hypothetical protein